MHIDDAQNLIQAVISAIAPLDKNALKTATRRMNGLLKPPGSLGRLEELGIQLAGIQGTHRPSTEGKLSLVYAGDHGVAAEGVSASPQGVSAVMIRAFCAGKAGINAITRQVGAELRIIDVGVATPYNLPENLINRPVRRGTGNIRIEPAMTRHEAALAVAVGIQTAQDAIAETGASLVGIGEMGIGNTTSAAALTAVFTGKDPLTVTGGGTGIGEAGLKRKVQVVRDAVNLHRPDPASPLDVLAALGGLEIAGMCGAILGAAAHGAMVLIDGFISGAAAMAATGLAPLVQKRMVLSHLSAEPGHLAVMAKLELQPLLNLGLRLGEGTGAAMAMPLVDAAAAILSDMGTLEAELVHLEEPS